MSEEPFELTGDIAPIQTEPIALTGDIAPLSPPASAEGGTLSGVLAPTARQDTIVETPSASIVSEGILDFPDIPTVPTPAEVERFKDFQSAERERSKKLPHNITEAKTIGEFFSMTGDNMRFTLQTPINGLNAGASGFYDTLDRSAQLISDLTGTNKVELFEHLRDSIELGESATTLPGKIIEGVAQAPYTVGAFLTAGKVGQTLGLVDRIAKTSNIFGRVGSVMGISALGAIERYGDGSEEMALGAMEYGLLAVTMGATASLPLESRLQLYPAMFGGMSWAAGDDIEGIAASATVGHLLAYGGGRGNPDLALSRQIKSALKESKIGQKFIHRVAAERTQGAALQEIAETVVTKHLADSLPALKDAVQHAKEGKTPILQPSNLRKLLDIELNTRLGPKFKDLKTEEKMKALLDRVDKNGIIKDTTKLKYIERTLKSLEETQGKMNAEAEAAKTISQPAVDKSHKIVEEGFSKADAARMRSEQGLRNRVVEWAERKVVDTSGKIKRALVTQGGVFGQRAIMHHDLIAGSAAKSQELYQRGAKSVTEGLSEADISLLSKIAFARRTTVIGQDRAQRKMKPIRNPNNASTEDHTRFLIKTQQEIGSKRFGELNALADNYFNWGRSTVKELQKSGIISEVEYNTLISMDWSKRIFLDKLDPMRQYTFGGQKIDIRDSGLHPLKGGSTEAAIYDIKEIMAQVAVRTVGRVMTNNANKAMHKFATEFPENTIARLPEKVTRDKKGKVKHVRVPHGFTRIDTFIDGVQQPMLMNSAHAPSWIASNPGMKQSTGNMLRILGGGALIRPLATGINPAFAITNFPRDVMHAWLVTNEYSAYLPRFAFQLGSDLMATYKGAWRKEGWYLDYIRDGGGMNFLTHQGLDILQGTGTRSLPRAEVDPTRWGRTKEALGKLNEFSELWMRGAIRHRALKNGKSNTESTWISRNYLDFAQGGTYAKDLDHLFPYLNAATQGIRGMFRGAKENPIKFAGKIMQLQAMEASFNMANYAVNPDAYSQISTRDKLSNWIFTLPMEPWEDAQGNKRYWYMTVAKDPSLVTALSPVTAVMEKFMYDRVPPKWLRQTFADATPVPFMGSTIPSAEAIYGVLANKDFWSDRKIWSGGEVPLDEEIKRFRVGQQPTPLIYQAWGQMTGLSPARTDWFVDKMSASNPYVQAMGKGFRTLTEGLTPQDKAMTENELIASIPVLNRVLKATHPYSVEADIMEDPIRRANAARVDIRARFDELYALEATDQLSGGKGAITAFVRSQDPVVQARLQTRWQKRDAIERVKSRISQTRGVPSQSWWYRLAVAESPEARAAAFHQEWLGSENRAGMERLAHQIDGFYTSNFQRAWGMEKKKFGTDRR